MKAVILAAGVNRRIDHLARNVPKCLLDVGGRSLLSYQLENLRRCDVNEITIVVGHGAEQVRAAAGDEVEYVLNERFAETNSIYSLWLAKKSVTGAFVLLNGDVLFYRGILDRLLSSPRPDALTVDPKSTLGDEEMKVSLDGDRVVEISKDIEPKLAGGENVGIVKWSADGARILFELLDGIIARGIVKTWAPFAYQAFLAKRPLYAVPTDGLPWIEIDFDEDLFLAREAVI